jgi:hypothetical protein
MKRITIRIEDAAFERIHKAAAAQGLSVQAYAHRCLESGRPAASAGTQPSSAVRELGASSAGSSSIPRLVAVTGCIECPFHSGMDHDRVPHHCMLGPIPRSLSGIPCFEIPDWCPLPRGAGRLPSSMPAEKITT